MLLQGMVHLHSTMYLLKLITPYAYHLPIRYLHSTMYLLKLICQSGECPDPVHLHSTMYLLKHGKENNIKADFLFTFHYVSIKTPTPERTCDTKVNLHSTMYLLKLQDHTQQDQGTVIYIPLCIY